ncbi:hypothetical protein FB381_3761 [Nocardioides albertanoniae]|uniref:Sodium:proton antiporter n=1 Tax=Nocardioides albertanoniae TaxID=1175486 RepID=A0A543AB53_9ACTN|nr:DUF6328 family protein [Nocardioides albertanoniae]TQL69842.1 hypothetical protein FB381_3761 [Nocardioides albertanoniae]
MSDDGLEVGTDGGSPGERPEQRITRNWNELLQELRVLQTGVQILTGFLLTVPFSPRFPDLDDRQKTIYLIVLVGSVITTCLIIAPVSFHRMLFRRRQRPWLVKASHACARAGLACFALVSALVVLLVFDVVVSFGVGVVVAVVVLVLFISLWVGLPLVSERHSSRRSM